MTLLVGNSTVNSSIDVTNARIGANSTFTMFTANATGLYANITLIANSTGPYGKTEGTLNVNSALTANNSTNLGGTAAASYQLNSTLNANIASYLPTYTGVVNGASHTVGTAFTANATVVNAVSYYAGTTLIGNTTGPYGKTEGTLNVNSATQSTNATNLNSQPGSFYTNATNISTGTLALARGGTNSSLTAVSGGVVFSNSTGMSITAAGSNSFVLTSNGSAPVFAQIDMSYLPESTFKKSCRAATTADLSAASATTQVLTGGLVAFPSQDGIALALNDRLLVKNQSNTAQNGIFFVSNTGSAGVHAWTLTRTNDANTSSKIASALVAIDQGTVNGGRLFDNDFRTTDTIGTTAMAWSYNIDGGGGVFVGSVYPNSNTLLLGNATSRWVISSNTINASGLITGSAGATITGITNTSTAFYAGTTLIGNTTGPYGKTEGTLNVNSATYATTAGSAPNPNAITFNNGGAGAASGNTYTGSATLTVSYNTIGAPSTTGTNASGTWSININGSAASATNASAATNATYATSAGTSGVSNADNYVNVRVIRNSNPSALNDGMFIGYGSTNSGATRIYGAGSTSGHSYIDVNGNWFRNDAVQYVLNSGTWSINVNGSAGSATNATYATSAGSATTSTTQALTDNSTNIVTTAWYNKAIYSTRGAHNMTGGGTISYGAVAGFVKWTARFIIIGDSKGTSTPVGGTTNYYDIVCPSTGSIDVVGTTAVTATADGIPLGAWQALYYDLGDGSAAGAGAFHIVRYDVGTANYMIPADWVLLAVVNGDNTSCKFTAGVRLDAGDSYDTNTYDDYYVPTAASATNATFASSATNASAATNATYATSAGSTTQAVTFNNGGAGAASGTTFNGGTARTISYNSIGAPSTTGTGASGTWSISINGSAASATNASAATNATYATSAGSATNATYATSAGSATNATNASNLGGVAAASYLRADTGDTYSGGVFQVSLPSGVLGSNTGAINTIQLYQANVNADAFLTFHVAGDYAAHFGLDGTTNDLFYGGWSAGANKYRVWHAGNDGSGSGLDADLLDGLNASSAAGASTIVARDSNGYIFSNYVNTTDDVNAGTISNIVAKFGDNYHRSASAAKVAAFISGQTMNISGSATNATFASSATNATFASSATNATYATSAGSATQATYLNGTASSAGQDNITTRVNSGFWESGTGTLAEGWPTDSGGWHHLISSTHSNAGNYYALQLSSRFDTQALYFRNTNGVGTTAWSQVVSNSGTWSISINGSAASATNATNQSGGTVSATTGSFSGDLSFNSGYGSSAVAYGVRVWAKFSGTTLSEDGNVTSVTVVSGTNYRVNFASAMVDANYAAQMTINETTLTTRYAAIINNQLTTSCGVYCYGFNPTGGFMVVR